MSLATSALLLSRCFTSRGFSLPTDVANLVVAFAATDKQPWIPLIDPVSGRIVRRAVNPVAFPRLQNMLEAHSFGQTMLDPLSAVVYNGVRHTGCRCGLAGYSSIPSGEVPTFIVRLHVFLELPSGQMDSMMVLGLYSFSSGIRFIKGWVYRPYLDEWSRETAITSFQIVNDVMYVNFVDIHGAWELDPALNIWDFDAHTPNIWD
jgi:hypothetical protein